VTDPYASIYPKPPPPAGPAAGAANYPDSPAAPAAQPAAAPEQLATPPKPADQYPPGFEHTPSHGKPILNQYGEPVLDQNGQPRIYKDGDLPVILNGQGKEIQPKKPEVADPHQIPWTQFIQGAKQALGPGATHAEILHLAGLQAHFHVQRFEAEQKAKLSAQEHRQQEAAKGTEAVRKEATDAKAKEDERLFKQGEDIRKRQSESYKELMAEQKEISKEVAEERHGYMKSKTGFDPEKDKLPAHLRYENHEGEVLKRFNIRHARAASVVTGKTVEPPPAKETPEEQEARFRKMLGIGG